MDTLADISFGGVTFSGDLLSPGLTSDPMFTELFDHQLLLPRSLPSPTPPAPPPPLFVFASVPSLDEWHVSAEAAAAAAGGGGGVADDYGVRAALELSQPSPCSDAGYASLHGSPARPCAPDTPPAAAPALSAVLDSPLVILPNTAVTHSSCGDHQLLRERLRDTSLQQRLNRPSFNLSQLLKPTGGDSDNRLTLSTVETVELQHQQQQLQLLPQQQLQQTPQQQLQQQPQQLQQQLPRTPTSTSWMMEQLGEVFDMALEQVHRENVDTCRSLGIAPDPVRWSADQVRVWLTFTCGQFGLDLDTTSVDTWSLDGAALCSLSEDQLRCWLPQETADVVYAQLSVWLSSKLPSHTSATSTSATSASAATTTSTCSVSPVDHVKMEPQTPPPPPPPPSFPSMPVTLPVSLSNGDVDSEDEEMETRCGDTSGSGGGAAAAAAAGSGGAARTGSNHIHLWQFLKELLMLTDSDNHNNSGSSSRSSNSPHHQLSAEEQQQQSGCVRWLDRSRGVFKIEDSVQVARLWGRRKRRPAMNYDKLSRSIRQYYKKGIMKKTERSQRLVYQFCHPYHL